MFEQPCVFLIFICGSVKQALALIFFGRVRERELLKKVHDTIDKGGKV